MLINVKQEKMDFYHAGKSDRIGGIQFFSKWKFPKYLVSLVSLSPKYNIASILEFQTTNLTELTKKFAKLSFEKT